MILGQALVCRHLGRGKTNLCSGVGDYGVCCCLRWLYLLLDWTWSPGQRQRAEYVSILNAFVDKKDSYYSIHQIGTTPHLPAACIL